MKYVEHSLQTRGTTDPPKNKRDKKKKEAKKDKVDAVRGFECANDRDDGHSEPAAEFET